jgi:hypothetical protein
MKTLCLLASASFLALVATPSFAQVALPTDPDPLVTLDIDLSTGALLGDQQVLTAIANVGGPSLVDVYLGLLEGSTDGANLELLNPTILTVLNSLGGPDLVTAYQALISSTGRTVDYVNGQTNSANQAAILNVVAATTTNIASTAASIGNSYALTAAANVAADLSQGNEGNGTSTLTSALAGVTNATETAAAIGNSASITSPASLMDLSIDQNNLGDQTAFSITVQTSVINATSTAAGLGNSLSVEMPGGSVITAAQRNSGTIIADLTGTIASAADYSATAAAIGNSYSLTSLNSGLAGNVGSSANQWNTAGQIAKITAVISNSTDAALTAAAIGNTVSINVE